MIELKQHNIRPYEELCMALEEKDRVAYISATGTGKSFVGGKYVEEHDGKTLILVPSDVIREGWKKILPDADVITYQSMLTGCPDLSSFSMLICDEMHHLGAERWGETFQTLTADFRGKILGMTATPVRFLDQARNMAEELFDGNMVIGVELPEAIDQGILPTMTYHPALFSLPTLKSKKVPHPETDQRTAKLIHKLDLLASKNCFQGILKKYLSPAEPHKVAVFVDSIPELKKVRGLIEEIYPDAGHFIAHSQMPGSEIKRIISDFESAEGFNLIYTVDLLNEGAHINGVDTVVMFRKTDSPIVYLQQLGRALNNDMADKRVTVFDFVSNYKKMDACIEAGNIGLMEIQRGIKNPDRQIIVCDHVVELKEVLDEIRRIFLGGWTQAEEDIMRDYYNQPGGKEKIMQSIPYRTWPAIKVHAQTIGIANDPVTKVTDQLREDVKKYYCEDGGIAKLEQMYPDIPPHLIRNVAKRMGVRIRKSTPWSKEEEQIILDNADKSDRELALLLPDRKLESIRWRRSLLGIRRMKESAPWSEEEDQILRGHTDIPDSQIQREYLPGRSLASIQARNHVLRIRKETRVPWDKAKQERFREAYKHGGSAAVRGLSEFENMTAAAVNGKAKALKVRSEAPRRGFWTESDESRIMAYIHTPIKDRPAVKDFAAEFPGRSFYAVQARIAVLKKKEAQSCEN